MRLASLAAVAGADGRWHPGIGDPTWMGWVTVLAYGTAAVLAVRAYRVARADARELRLFWGLVMLLLIALGINKQLDLQSWATEFARDLAHRQGWYAERRHVQVLGILAVAAIGVAGTLWLAFAMRRHLRAVWPAILGVAELVVFVIVRASSFHKMDALIGTTFAGARFNWVLELSGIALVGWGAWAFGRGSKGLHQGRPHASAHRHGR